ncbi:MAG: hypothetical protein JWR15_4728, partial [Prosthecobacter sp.]|nr:hypothetical protein [Prosthecobacter sp.]
MSMQSPSMTLPKYCFLLAAALLLPALSAKAQSSATTASISQASGFGPTNLYDCRPSLNRYTAAGG